MKRNPGPKQIFPGQHVYRLQRDFLGGLEQLAQDYPDVCCLQGLRNELWILQKPELVGKLLTGRPSQFEKGHALQRTRMLLGNGLLTAEGKDHLRRRRAIQPHFHKERIEDYAQTMVECAVETAYTMQGTVDFHESMNELALAIVGRTLLGTDLVEDHRKISRSLNQAMGNFKLLLLPFFSYLTKLPFGPMKKFEQARRDLHEVVAKIMSEPTPGSLAEFLLQSQIDDETVRDELLTMLLAGHETTANALTFAQYLLARHPEKAEKMYQELEQVLEGRLPTSADYSRLTYTRHIVDETLRLYPPAWAVGRKALVDLEWDPYFIPKGSVLVAPQWLLHRDSRYFDHPESFLPERWENSRPTKGTYFPFGGGTRLCVGEGFARMEAVLVLAVLGQYLRFELVDPGPIELKPGVTLRPKGGLNLRAIPVSRTASAAA